MGFKQLSERDRYIMEYMLSEKKPVAEIARKMGKHRSTIYREMKRGSVKLLDSELMSYEKYCADTGQRIHDERKHYKGAPLKVGNDIQYLQFIEMLIIEKKYSPQAALYYIRNHDLEFKTTLCKTTIYSYVTKGIFLNLTNQHLPVKRNKKREYHSTRVAKKNVKGRSIEERSKDILERDEFGHWEMDTVYSGKGQGKACLLVLTERMLRLERIIKIPDRTQNSVVSALNRLEKIMGYEKFKTVFKTITCDNGVEFLDFDGIEKSCRRKNRNRTTVYYCHPFCSGERGSNENLNRMIRRRIPKGSSIQAVSDEKVKEIENWMNDYPRTILNGKSANQKYSELVKAGICLNF